MKQEYIALLDSRRDMKNCIYVPSLCSGQFVVFEEGTGDNLLLEDRAEGYVDYINLEMYVLGIDEEPRLLECGGGMVLLKQYYADMRMEDILEAILEELSYPEACPDVETTDIIPINRIFDEEPY